MKKLFFISTVPVSLNLLLKGQLRYLNSVYAVTAISGGGVDLDHVAEREGVKTFAIEMERPISPIKDTVSLYKLYRYFKKEKPDIIHSITPKAGLLAMMAGKMAGVPVRIHTFTGLIFPYKRGFFQLLLIMMDRVLCSCATHVIPEGNGVKQDLVNYRITKKPLRVIANGNVNGVDLSYFSPQQISASERQVLREKVGFSDSDFVYIFVGRLVRDKGINELVAAFRQLQKSYHGVYQPKLLLVGSMESELDPLRSDTLREIDTNSDIVAVGFQPDVRSYYGIADALVFPSYREGFPNVVLQAGAMELPSIVTNISGCNEIIEDGVNGLVIPRKNTEQLFSAMERLLLESNLQQKLKSASREVIIDRYDQEKVWEAVLNEYKLSI